MQSFLLFYIIAGSLLILEAFTPGLFIFICFAFATTLTGLVDQFTNFDFKVLLGIDLALSLFSLFTVRPLLKLIIKIPKPAPGEFGSHSDKLVGKEAMVFKSIAGREPGVVKLFDIDETWLAKSQDASDIGQGSTVKITGLEGNHLIVTSVVAEE